MKVVALAKHLAFYCPAFGENSRDNYNIGEGSPRNIGSKVIKLQHLWKYIALRFSSTTLRCAALI